MLDRNWQVEIVRIQERDRESRAILGVSETAGRTEIRRAFRRASLVHRPDVHAQDGDASHRFHLLCCSDEFLTEGEASAALDELDEPSRLQTDGKYRLDNPWGYWCWWRDKYFGDPT